MSIERPGSSRREFFHALGAAGLALSSPLPRHEVQVDGRSRSALSAADFEYLGCFRCPPHAFHPHPALSGNQGANTAYSYYFLGSAPLASRVVAGERRFFIVGHGHAMNQVIEIALPARLARVAEEAPIAETRDFWAGPTGSVYGPGSSLKFSRNWPRGGNEVRTYGLLWDEQRQVLWWSIGEVGQNQAGGSPCLGYARLSNPTGSPATLASAEAFGPWDLTDTISNHTAKGMIIELPAAMRPHVGNRRLGMGGAHFHSILGPHDFGPAVVAIDEPTDATRPMVAGTGYPWNRDRQVLSYVNVLRYGGGSPGAPDARHRYAYRARAKRPPDYALLGIRGPFPAEGAGGTTVNPSEGTGWWTHLDVTHGAVWVETPSRQGMVFTGGTLSGRTWYTTSGFVPADWRPGDRRFGEAVPDTFDHGERTRIGAEFYHPAFFLLGLDDLIRGARERQYQQDIQVVRHPKQAPSGPVGGRAWAYGAPVYAPDERRLYVIQSPGWRDGVEFKPIIHCWQVAA